MTTTQGAAAVAKPSPAAELPILYRKSRVWFASFAVPAAPVQALLPDPSLQVVRYMPGQAVFTVAVFEYSDTSIGPYGELGIGFPVRHNHSTAIPLWPLLAEKWLDDLGPWVQMLPVDTEVAHEAGKRNWGFPKFIAKIDIDTTADRMKCVVSEAGRKIISIEVDKPSPKTEPIHFPFRLWSKLGDELLYTALDVDAVGCVKKLGARAKVTLEDHPRTAELQALGVNDAKCIEVRWFDEYRTALDRAKSRFRIGH